MEFQIANKRLFVDGKNFELENLEFIEEIGFGANAKVFTAKNIVTDRSEAVKIWKPRKLENYVAPEKFNQEIKKMQSLIEFQE